MLLEQLERPLLRDVALLTENLNRLQTGRMLLTAHNLPLELHQVLLLEAAGRMLRRAVKDLALRADRHGRTARLAILPSEAATLDRRTVECTLNVIARTVHCCAHLL